MKLPLLLSLAAFSGLAAVNAAEPATTAPAADFSAFKTADEFWAQIEALQKPPTEKPASREEAMTQARTWFEKQQVANDAFIKAFPEDPRRWQARLLSVRITMQLRRLAGETPSMEEERKKLDEILGAADAPATVKSETAFMRAMTYTSEFKTKPASYLAFHEGAAAFIAKYPTSPLVAQMQATQLRVLADDPTPQGAELLKKFAASTDTKQADAAKAILAKQSKMADLKSKPVELQFTAVSKNEVDLTLMRGKVILVDFWASWCGPCITEMPNVVSTYQRLHPKGFEIVGISLDQDKDKMLEAMKKHGMEWEQFFDGAGWKNKISSSYGIDSIPATWLIDKKGMLRSSGLRGEALAAAVEKLLKE